MASRSHRSNEDDLSIFRFSFLAEVVHDESASLIRLHGIQAYLPIVSNCSPVSLKTELPVSYQD